ncbi:hypothetical protein AVEN_246851-1 [Araneus ventricosus]|uniref:Uncharacterized protein n=1 Tax=Araneus ventricosus TaxID=182803 RepID=A0A4Y2KXZ4_ARAVE|nr:hypothetical protein AVEN_246851-1 [Araneus ventricosus]
MPLRRRVRSQLKRTPESGVVTIYNKGELASGGRLHSIAPVRSQLVTELLAVSSQRSIGALRTDSSLPAVAVDSSFPLACCSASIHLRISTSHSQE